MTGPLAPGLLLAMPQLSDPAFARAVVLVVEHDERGAFGLIVNRPTDILLSEVMRESGLDWPEPTQQVIWDGGPVQPEEHEPDGFILHHTATPKPSDDALEVADGFRLYPFPPEPATFDQLAASNPALLRFFMGYSAWGPGQLERELLQDAWLLLPPDPLLVFGTSPESMWESGFRSLGFAPEALAASGGLH